MRAVDGHRRTEAGGGRVAAFEVLSTGLRVKDAILHGESEGKTYYEIMQAGKAFGMTTFDDYIVDLYEKGLITNETAISFIASGCREPRYRFGEKCTRRGDHGYRQP